MNCREELIFLFDNEFKFADYGNKQDEDDSYQFIVSQMEIYFNDKKRNDNSITEKDYDYILGILEDADIRLQDVYSQILDYLEKEQQWNLL